MSKTAEGAQEYLKKYIYNLKDHNEYLDLIGSKRLKECEELRERRVA
jgi:hypothetical protein